MDKSSILMLLDGKISAEHKFMLNEKLNNVSEEKLRNIPLIAFKNPILAAVLGFFLGTLGVDRFYQGNIIIAVIKLALTIIGIITTFILVGFFILWVVYIYALIDIYFVYKAVQNDNYLKILQMIE